MSQDVTPALLIDTSRYKVVPIRDSPLLASCDQCRKGKVRCNKQSPCDTCSRRKINCLYTGAHSKSTSDKKMQVEVSGVEHTPNGPQLLLKPRIAEPLDAAEKLQSAYTLINAVTHSLENGGTEVSAVLDFELKKTQRAVHSLSTMLAMKRAEDAGIPSRGSQGYSSGYEAWSPASYQDSPPDESHLPPSLSRLKMMAHHTHPVNGHHLPPLHKY